MISVNTYTVYWLINKATNQPFYVGVTNRALHLRLSAHKTDARLLKGPIEKAYYIRSIDYKVRIVTIEAFSDKSEAYFFEQYWIQQLRIWGFQLCNVRCGFVRPKRKTHYAKLNLIALSKEQFFSIQSAYSYGDFSVFSNQLGLEEHYVRHSIRRRKVPPELFQILNKKYKLQAS